MVSPYVDAADADNDDADGSIRVKSSSGLFVNHLRKL